MRSTHLCLVTLALGLSVSATAWAQEAKTQPDPALATQLKALDYQYEIDEDGDYKMTFDVDDEGKRSQLVFVRSLVEDYAGFKVREIWSPGYKASSDGFPTAIANRLLEGTMTSKMGGWGKQGSTAIFIIRIAANADNETLDAAITAAINSADQMEAELTPGKDEF